jgi:hypothetical protein
MYYDTVTMNERSLRMLIDFVDSSHIMLGSDYVWGPMAQEFSGPAERTANDKELRNMRHVTAEHLFGIS